MDNNVSVNIIGTCICRDIFGMQPQNGGVNVTRFVQDISPVVCARGRAFLYKYDEINNIIEQESGMTAFAKRNFILDFIGKGLSYVNEVQADYLILDMGCCRFDCYLFDNGNMLTKMHNDARKQLDYMDKILTFLHEEETFETIGDSNEIIMLMEKYLPIYFENIKKMYPLNKIIFVETQITDWKICRDGSFAENPYPKILQNWKQRIDYANKLARKYLDGCHVIEFPQGVYADENHKWGPGALHYVKDYYNYAFMCMKHILNKCDKDKEKELLDSEKKKFETNSYDVQSCALRKTVAVKQQKENLEKINNRLMLYSDYFRKLLLQSERLEMAIKKMKDCGYQSCGFYGLSQVAVFWIDFFEMNGIRIDFVVENGGKDFYKGHIRQLNRNIEILPQTDVIIIADFIQMEYLRKILGEDKKLNVIDVYELIA